MAKKQLMTHRQYAAHRKENGLSGGSHTAVGKAVKAGRIKVNKDGLIDPVKADETWAANTDHSMIHGDGRPGLPGEVRREGIKGVKPAPVGDVQANPFMKARTEKEEAVARMARLKYEKESGALVEVATVKAAAEGVVAMVRTKLLAMPAKIRTQLPHIASVDVKMIDTMLREAMQEMADGMQQITKEQQQTA